MRSQDYIKATVCAVSQGYIRATVCAVSRVISGLLCAPLGLYQGYCVRR